MTSNIVSRLLPTSNGPPSIYETIRQHDEDSDESDVEERAGLILDEENLGERFHEVDLQNARIQASQMSHQRHANARKAHEMTGATIKAARKGSRPRWIKEPNKLLDVEEVDDDVPASLLIEGGDDDLLQKISNLPPPGFPPRCNSNGRPCNESSASTVAANTSPASIAPHSTQVNSKAKIAERPTKLSFGRSQRKGDVAVGKRREPRQLPRGRLQLLSWKRALVDIAPESIEHANTGICGGLHDLLDKLHRLPQCSWQREDVRHSDPKMHVQNGSIRQSCAVAGVCLLDQQTLSIHIRHPSPAKSP